METTSSGNVGRSNLPCESASQRAARETDQTYTRSDMFWRDKSRRTDPFHGAQVTHTGGRSSADIPETETRQEPERDNPAEIQVSMFAIC